MKFWDTKIGKRWSRIIHDHNTGLGIAGSEVSYLKVLMERRTLTNEILLQRLNRISEGLDKCKEAIDHGYAETKLDNENT